MKVSEKGEINTSNVQLFLAFGERRCLEKVMPYEYLRSLYPNTNIIINSTAGEIYNDKVHTNTIIVTAVEFEKLTIKTTQLSIQNHLQSSQVGVKLTKHCGLRKPMNLL